MSDRDRSGAMGDRYRSGAMGDRYASKPWATVTPLNHGRPLRL